VVVDRLVARADQRARIAESLELALSAGGGTALVAPLEGEPGGEGRTGPAGGGPSGDILLSSGYACTNCGVSFEPPGPNTFSFNSPQGMCTACEGLGTRVDFDAELLVPDPSLPFLAPCIAPLRRRPGRWREHIYRGVARYLGIDLDQPWCELPVQARRALLYGTGNAHITFEWKTRWGVWRHGGVFPGLIAELNARYRKATSPVLRRYYEQFMRQTLCPACQGARLNPQALAVTLSGRGADGRTRGLNIHELCRLPIREALEFLRGIELDGVRERIGREPLKEIGARLQFLVDVGLEYLTLDRPAPSLSGGESQRIRLASQIGSGLTDVLYVLDEPSIGLHPRDNRRLLDSLRRLRDMGNTVIVVEHDRDTMEAADLIVDFGPGPGMRGGCVVAEGTLAQVARCRESLTGQYLSGRRQIPVPATRRPVNGRPAALAAGLPRVPARRRR